MTDIKLRGYTLTEAIGCDGSNPYRGIAPDGSPVFVRLNAGGLADPEHAEVVFRLLNGYRQLKHPSLIRLRDFWMEHDLVLVTDWADAGSLGQGYSRSTSVAAEDLIPLFLPLAEAADFMHSQGIIHGAIKPHNMLLHQGRPLLDVPGLPDKDGQVWGTPLYMAPDVWENLRTPHSDQYSLGACFAELRLGRPLFPTAISSRALALAHLQEQPDLESLPAAERLVLHKALDKSPGQRYPSCVTFIEALGKSLRQ